MCTTDGTATGVLADYGGDKYPALVGADAIRAVPIARQCTLNVSASAHRITK